MGKEKWKGGGETKREASGGANFSSSLEKITKGLADSLINHDPTPPASSSISSRRRLPKAVALPRLFTATFVLGDRPPCRWPWEIGGPSPRVITDRRTSSGNVRDSPETIHGDSRGHVTPPSPSPPSCSSAFNSGSKSTSSSSTASKQQTDGDFSINNSSRSLQDALTPFAAPYRCPWSAALAAATTLPSFNQAACSEERNYKKTVKHSLRFITTFTNKRGAQQPLVPGSGRGSIVKRVTHRARCSGI